MAVLAPAMLAALLRFTSLGFGGGVLAAHPDERSTIDAVEATRVGQVAYFHVAYGGGYVYPLYGFVRALERVVGLESLGGGGAPPSDGAGHPFGEYVAARAWSALISTLAVAVTAVVGARLSGPGTGFVAATILAVSPLAVRDAHFAKADAATMLASALVLLVLTRRPEKAGFALLLGLATGLAISVKYQLGIALGAVAVVLLSAPPSVRGRLGHVLLFGLGAAPVVLLLNSFWLTHPTTTATLFRVLVDSQYAYVDSPWFAGIEPQGVLYHARVSLGHGFGLPTALLVLPAIALASWRGGAARRIAIVLVGQWLFLVQNPLTLGRNFLPLAPGLAVLVGDLVTGVVRALSGASRRRAAFLLATVVAALTFWPLLDSVHLVRVLGETDTRVLAYRWMQAHAPGGARLEVRGTPPGAPKFGFPISRIDATAVPEGGAAGPSRGGSRRFLVWHQYPLPYSSGELSPRERTAPLVATFDPFSGPVEDAIFEEFDAFYLPLRGFSGVSRPGPRIEIRALE